MTNVCIYFNCSLKPQLKPPFYVKLSSHILSDNKKKKA